MEEPEEVYNEDDFEAYPESAFDESNDKAYDFLIKKAMKHPKLSKVYGLLYYNYSRPYQYYFIYAVVFGLLDFVFGSIGLFSIISMVICAEYANIYYLRTKVLDRCIEEVYFQNMQAKEGYESPLSKSEINDIWGCCSYDISDLVPFFRRFVFYKKEYLKILAFHLTTILLNSLYLLL
jgi:hypothetical protein